jgi:Asp-tRNA(Asn)/Glu-tRNA(Gln) amidotransferase A subunit family amidase
MLFMLKESWGLRRRAKWIFAASLGAVIFVGEYVFAQMQAFRLEEATVRDINAAFDSGSLSSEQLVQLYLSRIEAYDQNGPQINSIISLNPDALQIARMLDLERQQTGPRSLLHGIPVLVKDNIDTMGMPTTAGSLALKEWRPSSDAFVVGRLREAGAIILGKNNLWEFASGSSYDGSSPVGGQARNPYDLGRSPGGSSSGTGAAISANFATVGLGTDTNGSIAQPSMFNSLVGIRPTLGLVSRNGLIPLSLTRDVIGPMTRTVADAAAVLDVIAGMDPADPTTLASEGQIPTSYTDFLDVDGLSGSRIGVVRQLLDRTNAVLNPEALSLIDRAVADFRALGAEVIDPVDIGFQPNMLSAYYNSLEYDMNRYLAKWGDAAPFDSIDELIAEGRIGFWPFDSLQGDQPPEEDPQYARLMETRNAVRTNVLDAMEANQLDALLYLHPLYAHEPPVIGEDVNGGSPLMDVLARLVGFPAITIPAGFTSQGLPIAIELVGRPYSEPTLIKLAHSFEQGAYHRRPPTMTQFTAKSRFAFIATDSNFDNVGDRTLASRGIIGERDSATIGELNRLIAKFDLPDVSVALNNAKLRFFLQTIQGTPAGSVSLFHSVADNDRKRDASDYEDTSYLDTLMKLVGPQHRKGNHQCGNQFSAPRIRLGSGDAIWKTVRCRVIGL